MTDQNQRLMNWQIKTDTGKVKAILDDLRPDMLKRYEAAVVSLSASARTDSPSWREMECVRRIGRGSSAVSPAYLTSLNGVPTIPR